jgi:acetyl-CoA C-acetyltransferase
VRDVSIIGFGQTKVGEHWEKSLRDLAVESLQAAMADAGIEKADALYVGNMLGGEFVGQEHLGTLIADFAGLRGTEAFRIEAACCSGGAALRQGYLAVASGLHDIVAVTGVEKMTDALGCIIAAGLAMAADGDYEASQGLSLVAVHALLMRRYMHEYGATNADFAMFAVNAHRNAVGNPYAMFRRPISKDAFEKARMVADPINLLDSAPVADGAATVILCPTEQAREFGEQPIRIAASAVGTDSVALHDRHDSLFLESAHLSARRAYQQAGVSPADVDVFELHDAFTIMSALSLEACGFAERGEGYKLAQNGNISLEGPTPICTMGGLKARGNPVGATGVYQVVEVVEQLRGQVGSNQVKDPRLGMAQNIGGSGATAITHILEAMN